MKRATILEWGDISKKPSLILLVCVFIYAFWFADFWRPYNSQGQDTNFVWDMFGYYSYLPATFCNDGSFFWNGTSDYYLSKGPSGEFFPKYTCGLALLQAPFFALGYLLASLQQQPLDGFSQAFATSVRWGTLFYVLVGLFFLRKFLLFYFSEGITALTLAVCVFGTMLFLYTYVQSEMPHAYLFALFSVFLYYTQRWHLQPGRRYALGIAFSGALATLIRPTEVFIFLFFIFWGVKSISDLREKFLLFISHYQHLLLIAFIVAGIWIPQLLFWKEYTGSYFYFSYQDEKFFWNDPQIFNILLSYRKGWITYTPVVALVLPGVLLLKKEFPFSKWLLASILAMMIYVYSCWWDWNYGGCFGARAFCQHIAFLSVPLAGFFEVVFCSSKKFILKTWLSAGTLVFTFSAVLLNIGQTYQYQELRKIHPWAMSKQVYWDVFRKYHFSDAYHYKFWGDVKFPDHERWRKGEGRDDK